MLAYKIHMPGNYPEEITNFRTRQKFETSHFPVTTHGLDLISGAYLECSETLAYKIQMPGNYPEESIQHSEHNKSLKPAIFLLLPMD